MEEILRIRYFHDYRLALHDSDLGLELLRAVFAAAELLFDQVLDTDIRRTAKVDMKRDTASY